MTKRGIIFNHKKFCDKGKINRLMTTKKLRKKRHKKKKLLRNNEYYDMQPVYDRLYEQSEKGEKFTNLLKIITSNENIFLAYRNIKKNKGSKTAGTNKKNIIDIGNAEPENSQNM